MARQKISVSIEIETVSRLLAALSKERKNFPTKSELVAFAVKDFLENESSQDAICESLNEWGEAL